VLTHPLLWPAETGRHWLVVAGAFAFAVLVIRYGLAYRAEFPDSYLWSEMLINYSGGFVRRGLLVEIAYRPDWLIPARELITTLILAAYVFVGAWLVSIAIRAGYLVATLFLLSPATLLFPVYDFAAFGRKDVFIPRGTRWLRHCDRTP
jgi:hypothetical protein